MADQEKDKQLDEMLDSLLANYSSAEPRPGLETRILANLRDASGREASPASWNFRWLWAGAAVAAAIIVAAVLIAGGRHTAPPNRTVVQTSQPALQQPEVQRSLPANTATSPGRHGHKIFNPARPQDATLALSQRPPIFPTPTRLSEQEQLLLSYFAGTPREEMIAQSRPEELPVSEPDQSQAIPDLTHIPQKPSNTR
jgi:hypothetical protein